MSNKVAKREKAIAGQARDNPTKVTLFKKAQMIAGSPFACHARVILDNEDEYDDLFNASCEILGEPHMYHSDDSRFIFDGVWMGTRYEWGMSGRIKTGYGLVYAKESDWLAVKAKAGWKD